MATKVLAIALCRVSSLEQLKNHSLSHQKDNVLKAAETLGATIPPDGLWEGQVSSKKGVNFNRKDLLEMVDYCKKHPAVKYLIVQEVDRFMRSPDEQTYWYVRFKHEFGVQVYFADNPELNEDTHDASLLRYLDGWRAGGSNEERMKKSINGQSAALKEGRYPFSPKPGYRRGYERGVQEIHPVRGPALKAVLTDIAEKRVTPSEGLVNLNNSGFMTGHAPYKMDKFRQIVTDPFYAGIVEIDKQVKVRNENGLHEPLITKTQHLELVRIMSNKRKSQSGPKKAGNPKYPLNTIVECTSCIGEANGKIVGFDHSNGRPNGPRYEKYRCRACGRYWTRESLHNSMLELMHGIRLTSDGVGDLMEALDKVWAQEASQAEQETTRIKHKLSIVRQAIQQQVEAAIDPSNADIKVDILQAIDRKKAEVLELEEQLTTLQATANDDKQRFLHFAFDFVKNMGTNILTIDREDKERCKQIVFPGGLYVDANGKVYTTEMSPLYRLATNKKGTEVPSDSHLVRVRGL